MKDQVETDPPRPSARRVEEVDLLTAFTLVMWVLCLVVGLTGVLAARPHKPVAPPPPKPVVEQVELLKLDLSDSPPPPAKLAANQSPQAPPPLPRVAMANPMIAFQQPVEGPVMIVPMGQASPVDLGGNSRTAVVQRMEYGTGVMRQPEPDYPMEAQFARQQGTVTVQFVVDESGRVRSAHLTAPCRWPLLNQAVLDVVRTQWQFPAGHPVVFETTITFN